MANFRCSEPPSVSADHARFPTRTSAMEKDCDCRLWVAKRLLARGVFFASAPQLKHKKTYHEDIPREHSGTDD
jgi:hypothetical protein